MARFAIRFPYFVIVSCLMVMVLGLASLVRMPVDLFPGVPIPVVAVATFYTGMPPQQIEMDITSPLERMFTLASNVDHIESRSLPGVSIIKVHFQPGSNPDSALTSISNLAMAQLRQLPPGTLPPVILPMDSSSMPVCLATFEGRGLTEKDLFDIARYNVRNQLAAVPGASVPIPFGGKQRQIQVYADPLKLQAYGMSIADVVAAVNASNLILPAGFVRLGNLTYNLYTNSQVPSMEALGRVPLRTVGQNVVTVSDIGEARDDTAIQTNVVRIDGQRSVYVPVLKQGGDSNTIAVVDGVQRVLRHLLDVPKALRTKVEFDQSQYVKSAIENLIHEGLTGLFLTSLMILVFLGSPRATGAVMLSIPLSTMALFSILNLGGGSMNTMVLGGLALAFSRLIDDSVIVLENIYRHLEQGQAPRQAAEDGGREVALPVLAASLTTAIVFFPVSLLSGVSRYLFSAMGLAVALSVLASWIVAMSVVPLFCSRWIEAPETAAARGAGRQSLGRRFNAAFNRGFARFLDHYQRWLAAALRRPVLTVALIAGIFVSSLAVVPHLGLAFFPRSDPGQFTILLKAPAGLRLELTEQQVERVEALIRRVVAPEDLGLILSNIGSVPNLPAIFSTNSSENTATVQVSLREHPSTGSFEYLERTRRALREEMPELAVYLFVQGLADAVVNQGKPAPIDIQVSGNDLDATTRVVQELNERLRGVPGIGDLFVPQENGLPALLIEVDRIRAAQVGLTQRDVISSLTAALTSDIMTHPSFWIDPKSGNNYFLTVQYPLPDTRDLTDLENLVLRGPEAPGPTTLSTVASLRQQPSPNEVDHYQIRRVQDLFVAPAGEAIGGVAAAIERVIAGIALPEGVVVSLRGAVQSMRDSFKDFAVGLSLSVVLVYLVLVAQLRSFVEPFIILLAIPTGITGVILILKWTGTTVNLMSLMGVVMLTGVVVSNSILIVEFTKQLRERGLPVHEALVEACRTRLRPVLMTSLATIIGMVPMALKLSPGAGQYAPLARAIIGGLSVSVVLTLFLVPSVYLLIYRRGEKAATPPTASPLASGAEP